MGSSLPTTDDPERASTSRPRPRRALRPRKRRRAPRAAWVILGVLTLAILSLLVEFAVHTYRTDPRDTRTILERELRVNTLQPREQVREAVSVFQRQPIDYFRATRGLLVLTDRRLLFLGLLPRDLLASGEGPPTFIERDFALDTLVQLSPSRTFFQIARAVHVDAPEGSATYGVPSSAWPQADSLMALLATRHAALHREGKRLAALRRDRALERRAATIAMGRPFRYVVKRGDALSTIASQWNTSIERLREWNAMQDNRIRVGRVLVVRR